MANTKKEIVPGLTSNDVKKMVARIDNRKDGNHPQLATSENGFVDILQKGKPIISASPTFIRKVNL